MQASEVATFKGLSLEGSEMYKVPKPPRYVSQNTISGLRWSFTILLRLNLYVAHIKENGWKGIIK